MIISFYKEKKNNINDDIEIDNENENNIYLVKQISMDNNKRKIEKYQDIPSSLI